MKKAENNYHSMIVGNILKILKSRDLGQADLIEPTGLDKSKISRIISGQRRMDVNELSIIATALGLSVIDLITYPDKYVKNESAEREPTEVLLQMRLTKEKKEQVLKLVFGEHNIEILNK